MPASEISALLTCRRENKTQGVNYRLRLQGVGNWFNTAIILICLAAWGQYNPPYSASDLQGVWRTSTALGLVPIIFMLWWRTFKLKESGIWKVNMKSFVYESPNNENYILLSHRIIYLFEFFFLFFIIHQEKSCCRHPVVLCSSLAAWLRISRRRERQSRLSWHVFSMRFRTGDSAAGNV